MQRANRPTAVLSLVSVAASLLFACTPPADDRSASAVSSTAVASSDGVSISYDVAGEGELALVFVHGWSCDRTYWDSQVAAFSSDHRIVRVDLAGHGDSGTERRDYSMASFGADVAAVVDDLGLKRLVLVGHSMGGDVIMEAAKLMPGRVEGLVWLDTYKSLPVSRTEAELAAIIDPFGQDFRTTTEAFVRGMFPGGADTALVAEIANDMASAPPTIALSALAAALRYAHEIPASLKAVQVPVVAINPDNSPTDEASLRAHGVEPLIVPGVGHFLMIEDPTRFNSVLRMALTRFAR